MLAKETINRLMMLVITRINRLRDDTGGSNNPVYEQARHQMIDVYIEDLHSLQDELDIWMKKERER